MNNNSKMNPEMIAKIFNDGVPIIHRDELWITNFLESHCPGLDPQAIEAVRAAIPLPSLDDVYEHYLNLTRVRLMNELETKPTLFELCQETDSALRCMFPSAFRMHYETIRKRIIESFDIADVHCPGCGVVVDMRDYVWGDYCSKTCYRGDDNA